MYNKILVTGGSGLLGTHLKKILPEAIYVSSKDFDLTIITDVENMFDAHRPDVVIHLAARVSGFIDNIRFPASYYDENILMNTNTLKIAHKHEIKRFITTLSSCAFPDEVKIFPIKEEDLHEGPPNETTFSYGIAKRSFAVQIEAYNKQYGTKYQYLIPCNLYGESGKIEETRSHFITALIVKIHDANKSGANHITLYGDGTPLRQFMHAQDVANVIKLVIERNITQSFNVAPKQAVSIKEIAEIAIKATNSNLDINFDSDMPNGQMRKDLDVRKMMSLISNYECISLEEGIKSFYNFYKSKVAETSAKPSEKNDES